MRYFYSLLFFCYCFFSATSLSAQAANDECDAAIPLPEEVEYCSGVGQFSNVAASPSFNFNDYPACIEEREQNADVWFSFVALRNSVNVIVTGATDQDPGGTLQAPQFILYRDGICTDTSQMALGCRSPFRSPQTGQFLNGGNILFTNLIEGATYYIMVGARNGETGSFQLCVNQFDNVPEPSGDCATGVLLCDKSPFSIDFISGNGDVNEDLEVGDVCGDFEPGEDNSAWYKWTCDQPGSLELTIDPLGAAFNEDIDFVVYELPGGIDDCDNKQALRRMFSGESQGNGDGNLPCLGDTGMSLNDGDESESCGCQAGNNNFVSAIDMVAGRSYALVILNFSGSGDGVAIEWGGTGTFLGLEPDVSITQDQACIGEAIQFADNSTSVDPILSQEWNFGATATPRTASGPGPHSVSFNQPGEPNVTLVIETRRGCREIIRRREVEIVCCDDQFVVSGSVTDVLCPGDSTGLIDLDAVSTFSPMTVTYDWSNDADTEDVTMLGPGTYTVTVTDESTCTAERTFTVDAPPAFTFDTLIGMPDCAGGTNGTLRFTVLGGGAGGYEYSFNGGAFSTNNQLGNLPVTIVDVTIRDAVGCTVDQAIAVDELELGLREGEPVFREPTCFGDSDGEIEVQVANGRPTFQYDFGQGFQDDNLLAGVPAGTYPVTARDADGCLGEFLIEITEPPAIDLALDGTNSTCFETDDGTLTTTVSGGRPGYAFSWTDGQAAGDSLRADLPPGVYGIQVTDDNGCVRTESITLTQPAEIFPVIDNFVDLTCFGDSVGSFTLSATGGTPDYTYSSDGENFQTDSLLDGLRAGDYLLYVMDANGCTDSISGALTEPEEFIVVPGPDLQIALGFSTALTVASNYDPGVQYAWGPDSLTCLDPPCTRVLAGPLFTTLYTVVGTNAAGCIDSAQVELRVVDEKPFYVPNAFSPNADGQNDGFTIYGGRAVAGIDRLNIYDRWGGQVFGRSDFPANDPELGWDGTVDGQPVNPAVFVYTATIRFINGSTEEVSGDVTVVR